MSTATIAENMTVKSTYHVAGSNDDQRWLIATKAHVPSNNQSIFLLHCWSEWQSRNDNIVDWIFNCPKLPIGSKTVVNSWGCSWRFQQMLQVRKWCSRPVPTQVNCKNLGFKRQGIAWDANVTLPKPPKSSLLFNSAQTSAAEALNTPAWQTKHTGREEGHILRICAVVVAADALHWRYNHHTTDEHQTQRYVHSLCLRLANKHQLW